MREKRFSVIASTGGKQFGSEIRKKNVDERRNGEIES